MRLHGKSQKKSWTIFLCLMTEGTTMGALVHKKFKFTTILFIWQTLTLVCLLVFFIPVGKWDLRQSIIDGFKTEMERNIYRVLANMMKAVEDSGQEQFRLIIDLAGLSYSQIIHYESTHFLLMTLIKLLSHWNFCFLTRCSVDDSGASRIRSKLPRGVACSLFY